MDLEKTSNLPDEVRKEFREGIMDLQDVISSAEGCYSGDSDICPLTHHFSDGIYCREIFIPAGQIIVGKIHKHSHPNFLLSGTVEVVTESTGTERITGPVFMISEPGTKRALKSITDLVWITVHANPTNTEDLRELEERAIAEDYDSFEKFKKTNNKALGRVRRALIKMLS
jgi:hypothetical protein